MQSLHVHGGEGARRILWDGWAWLSGCIYVAAVSMNLSRKIIVFNFSLVAMVAALGGISLWNMTTLWRATAASDAEYGLMDKAEAAGTQVGWLQTNLRAADGATYRDVKYFAPIQTMVTQLTGDVRVAAGVDDGDATAERNLATDAAGHLNAAVLAAGMPGPGAADEVLTELQKAQASLEALAKLAPGAARRHVTVVAASMPGRLIWLCGWLLAVLVVSTVIHWRQYRALVKPLLWLRDAMRQSAAAGEYRQPVVARGEAEFKEVATYFNGLARELAELYKGLEEKVIARSRELVRSERLASVGFLAAGVAHEINNPLSIISGYAELAERDLRLVLGGPGSGGAAAELEATALANAMEAQEIIREESFRCKEITTRLLSLARGGSDGREALSLAETARQVATLTKGLKNYRNRKVIVEFEAGEALQVVGNPTEMKQVLLNLMVNSLEAVAGDGGEVRIGGRRSGPWVELTVSDNGKGMTPEMLEHIFEPFFTAKRGANESGTGLGLSITHAIIEHHGGRIRAQSAGPGLGSQFIVMLPSGVNGNKAAALALQGEGK